MIELTQYPHKVTSQYFCFLSQTIISIISAKGVVQNTRTLYEI